MYVCNQIALRLSIRLLGVDDLCLRQLTYENFSFKKKRSSCKTVVTATALRMPDGIKTHSQNVKLIIFTLVFFRLALLGGWGNSVINILKSHVL